MSSNDSTTPFDQATKLIKSGHVDQAIQLLDTHMASNTSDTNSQELLAMCLYRSRKFPEARDAFTKLTRMDPRGSAAWVNLGAVENLLKEYKNATEHLRKAIQLDKKCAPAYYNLGIAQKAMNANSMAVAAYKEAMRLAPEMPEPYANLANLYIDMKNFRQAVKTAEQGCDKCPDFKKIHLILEKAKSLKEGIRREEAPLGRLVDEEELAQKQVRVGKRDLGASGRNEERDTLRDHAKTIRQYTRPIVAAIDSHLHQQLHVLSLVAAQKDARGEGPAAYEQLLDTMKEIELMRTKSVATIAEIRQHLEKTDPGL